MIHGTLQSPFPPYYQNSITGDLYMSLTCFLVREGAHHHRKCRWINLKDVPSFELDSFLYTSSVSPPAYYYSCYSMCRSSKHSPLWARDEPGPRAQVRLPRGRQEHRQGPRQRCRCQGRPPSCTVNAIYMRKLGQRGPCWRGDELHAKIGTSADTKQLLIVQCTSRLTVFHQ